MDSEFIEIKTIFKSRATAELVAKELVTSHFVASAKITDAHVTYCDTGIFYSDNVSEFSCITIKGKCDEIIACLKRHCAFTASQFIVTPLVLTSGELVAWIREQVGIKGRGSNKT